MSKSLKNNKEFLKGDRIFLRPIRLSDANRNYLYWMNDPEVNKYLEGRFEKWSIKKLKKYIQQLRHDRNMILFAIILKNKKEHIGNIKIGPIDRIHQFADVGLIIGDKSCWGKGYATEVIKLITNYAFNALKLHKLTAGAYKENVGSIKAFQKSGYIIEGVRKKQYLLDTKYTDQVLMSIIKK